MYDIRVSSGVERVRKERAIAIQNVGAAANDRGRNIVELAKGRQSALEVRGRKSAPQPYLSTNPFQGSLLRRRNAIAVPANILDGRALAADLRTELLVRSQTLRARGVQPRLAILCIGENEASIAYVRSLGRVAEATGIATSTEYLAEDASAPAVRRKLEEAGGDPAVHGVLLQQPLPAHLSIREIADAIPLLKDVDGAHPINQGRLAFGTGATFVPATPAAVMLLLERSPHWPLRGRTAVAIGRSIVVGAPVAMLMLARDATVTILHKESGGIQPYTRMADVVVTATGVPGLLTGADIKPGATVIDVGTTLVNGVLTGDVAYESAAAVAGAITPVPGGVGPVTNIALLRNVLHAAETAPPVP